MSPLKVKGSGTGLKHCLENFFYSIGDGFRR